MPSKVTAEEALRKLRDAANMVSHDLIYTHTTDTQGPAFVLFQEALGEADVVLGDTETASSKGLTNSPRPGII